MGLLSRIAGAFRGSERQLSYDGAERKDRRKQPAVSHAAEDRILPQGKRDILSANARDLNRNYAVAASAIRQHLNYVCSHRFAGRCADRGLSRDLETLMERWSRREGCDAAGRHRLSRFIRIAEIRRILDGDVGVMRLAAGTLQGIEGDRIRSQAGADNGVWLNGVKTNDAGRALAYAIHKRTRGGSLEFERTVPASNLFLHGFYDRFDQVRGVSPVAAALNQFRDVYENFDYALAKAKVSQLFALAFYRDAETAAGEITEASEDEEEGSESTGYKVDFGRGPAVLDLDPGDKAEFLESNNPSNQFQDFTKLVTMVALKSLDIPYSFFDESHTNFFGSRGAFLHYDRSCDEKRADVQDLLRWVTVWRVGLWIADGTLKLPRGADIGSVNWEWIPQGMPWWDPAKEVTGQLKAIGAALDSPYRITKETGTDFERNVDDMSRAVQYARSKGVRLSFDLAAVEGAKAEPATVAEPDAGDNEGQQPTGVDDAAGG